MTTITYDPGNARFPDVNEYHPVNDWDALTRGLRVPVLGFKVGNGDEQNPMSDSKFGAHLIGAEARGLMCLGYWYSASKVDDFLKAFVPKAGRIPVLDFEGSATVARAETFVEKLHAEWGRWPAFYGRRQWIDQGEPGGTAIANCPYWGAEYGPELKVPRGVGQVMAWQFYGATPGDPRPAGAPMTFPGVSGKCDLNMLVFSRTQLEEIADLGKKEADDVDALQDMMLRRMWNFAKGVADKAGISHPDSPEDDLADENAKSPKFHGWATDAGKAHQG